jgi:hypothetical protein
MSDRKKGERQSQRERLFIFGPIVLVVGLTVIYALSCFSIFSSVKSICSQAKEKFNGDCVEALTALIESEEFSFKEKNKAIYALGQIGDKRALPLLERLNTGKVQEKPYDPSKCIVQYSVKKAIKQIKGEFSLTRWMYRWLE